MMDELEGMAENAMETIEEAQRAARDVESDRNRWITSVSLISSLMAILGTVLALIAAFAADDAFEKRVIAIVDRNSYESENLQYEILLLKFEAMAQMGKISPDDKPEELIKLEQNLEERDDRTADELEKAARFIGTHHVIGFAITLLQVCIALSGISIIAKRKRLWHIGLGFASAGIMVGIAGLVRYFLLA
ncbi:MAG: DUF4337 domain-containing protein [Desulfobulbaceae bacterium]|nr:DUF4337 domain-containing protein [Desulfobulbaceae bacterium]